MKKFLVIMLCVAVLAGMCVSFAACGGDGSADIKVGVIWVGDATEGYTEAHIKGVETAVANIEKQGKKVEVLTKELVKEDDSCAAAARDLVAEGCTLIFSNSYGHQDYMAQVAGEYPDITFVSATGDYAALTGLKNFKNAFTYCYEGRYVSGIVAGMKLKELLDNGTVSKEKTPQSFEGDNVKVGYVGAYTYAEVISGYTAFLLGVQSIVPNTVMEVQFTDSWFDIDQEANAAETLVNNGCVIISQHADSTGAPSKIEELLKQGKVCYSVGYNVDMLSVAPNAALTSATNDWSVYYEYAIGQALKGEEIATNWAHGYARTASDRDAVGVTTLGKSVAAGTQEAVDSTIAKIKSGELHVFDISTFTVGGAKLESYTFDSTIIDFTTMKVKYPGQKYEAIKADGDVRYFAESEFRSAPYFSVNIDGIKWLNKTMA